SHTRIHHSTFLIMIPQSLNYTTFPYTTLFRSSDKEQTKTILAEKDIPTAKGQQFSSQDNDETIVAYANKLGYPLVVKPTNASFGDRKSTRLNSSHVSISYAVFCLK